MHDKTNLFYATITQRYNLCKHGSHKHTFHVVLSIKGSSITYQTGDSIAVQATNNPELISNTCKFLKASGEESIIDRHHGTWSLHEFLLRKANLVEVPRKLITELAERQTNPQKKERLEFILNEKEALKEYQASHEVWDALEENQEVLFAPQELCSLLQPLLPRFYSIASSMAAFKDEIHLTVAELQYVSNGHLRYGVCTHYLCSLAPLHEPLIPIYVHPSQGFTLPQDPNAPIIMVGPGTGVAPFRAFMQEREALGAAGLNWLFFGECHRATEFFYEEYWEPLIQSGKLRLDTAFSRDQEHKIYVQHRMLEHGEELFALLDSGAYLYVCGDAHHMAKDVDAALHQLVQTHGSYDAQQTKDYIKKLKAEKRYLRDVY